MSANNFNASLAAVLKDEGGNDDDPQDHGGRTSRGITQREYDRWRTSAGLPTRDVWTADDSEIRTIYHDDYWLPWGDQFPVGLDYMFFDICVNAGTHRATILLQRTLGVTEDGHIGPITLGKLAGADPGTLVRMYDTVKRAFYNSLNQLRFIKGWLNRCDHVVSVASAMISQQEY